MAEWSKALRSGRSPLLWAGVRISLLTNIILDREQSGAVEACWAHNPEVRRSKLRSANDFLLLECNGKRSWDILSYLQSTSSVPLAQRIARWTSNPKVLGSIPRWDEHWNFLLSLLEASSCKWHLALDVRMAEWSKAPDSRFNPCSPIGSGYEISGPR